MAESAQNPVIAAAHVHALLERLHARSSAQEATLGKSVYSLSDKVAFDDMMRDQLVALDQDKCHFVYQTIRMIDATNVVEAGTSYGVSTIYLALAVGQNHSSGKVFATEKESAKVAAARDHWHEAGSEVEPYIELREGDLLQTLSNGLPSIDLLLLDIWAPLALPTLKIVQPRLRPGAVVIVDNIVSGAERYKELIEYMRTPGSGFSNLTVPYQNGLEVSVYHPQT